MSFSLNSISGSFFTVSVEHSVAEQRSLPAIREEEDEEEELRQQMSGGGLAAYAERVNAIAAHSIGIIDFNHPRFLG